MKYKGKKMWKKKDVKKGKREKRKKKKKVKRVKWKKNDKKRGIKERHEKEVADKKLGSRRVNVPLQAMQHIIFRLFHLLQAVVAAA